MGNSSTSLLRRSQTFESSAVHAASRPRSTLSPVQLINHFKGIGTLFKTNNYRGDRVEIRISGEYVSFGLNEPPRNAVRFALTRMNPAQHFDSVMALLYWLRFLDMRRGRSEEHTSELQSLMRISYAVFCLKKNTRNKNKTTPTKLPNQKKIDNHKIKQLQKSEHT